jgi:hypothetical protein
MNTLCPICGQRNDTTGHTCWVQTIAPTAWNNHHEIRTDNTAVIYALEARIALLEAAIRKHRDYIVENDIGDCPEDENLWALLQEDKPHE